MRTLALLLIAAACLQAQLIQVETQVPMDTAGKVLEVTPELRSQLALYPEVENFLSAKLFRSVDSTFILEVAFSKNGALIRSRTLKNAAAVQALRQELSQRLLSAAQPQALDQSGRTGLIVGQTLMGLSFYGWAVPSMLNIEQDRQIVAAYMLVGAAGFTLPYYLTRNRPVSTSQSMLTFYGATRGILYGFLIKNIFAPPADSPPDKLGPSVLASITGSVAAFHLVGKYKLDIGNAELTGVMGDFGTGLGTATAHLANLWKYDSRKSAAHATMLAMTAGGLGMGMWLSQRESYTRGDAYVLRMNGLLGAQCLTPLAAAISGKKEKSYTAGAVLGAVLGIGVGNHLLAKQNFTFSEGVLISCGHIAGGLLAGGLTYLLDTQDRYDEVTYLSTTALGSLAGHVLLYSAFSQKRNQQAANWDRLRISLAPLNLIAAKRQPQPQSPSLVPPFFTVHWKI
ncbi:hypothetical protein GX408_09035 [bacterium]|nr:hypothetical protein [bacterium]